MQIKVFEYLFHPFQAKHQGFAGECNQNMAFYI